MLVYCANIPFGTLKGISRCNMILLDCIKMGGMSFFLIWAIVFFLLIHQPYLPREQLLHHSLLYLLVLCFLLFERRDFVVHRGEDGGNGGLLFQRQRSVNPTSLKNNFFL